MYTDYFNCVLFSKQTYMKDVHCLHLHSSIHLGYIIKNIYLFHIFYVFFGIFKHRYMQNFIIKTCFFLIFYDFFRTIQHKHSKNLIINICLFNIFYDFSHIIQHKHSRNLIKNSAQAQQKTHMSSSERIALIKTNKLKNPQKEQVKGTEKWHNRKSLCHFCYFIHSLLQISGY